LYVYIDANIAAKASQVELIRKTILHKYRCFAWGQPPEAL